MNNIKEEDIIRSTTMQDLAAFLTREFIATFEKNFNITPKVSYSFTDSYKHITVQDVINVAEELFAQDPDNSRKLSLVSASRTRVVVTYRIACFHILRSMGHNYSEIGRHFKKDHATVLFHCRRVNDLLKIRDPYLTDVYKKIENELKNAWRTYGNVEFNFSERTKS